MKQSLVTRRDQVMARADAALDAAWPARLGDEYVREMRWAAAELETIAAKMRAKSVDPIEQIRTYSNLGSVYADLEPALGKEMLLRAKTAYQAAEALLEGNTDELERAKLNFNFANTLRQIDPNDLQQLQEAKSRLLEARMYFESKAPQHLSKVDAALQSVESLLRIAPLANAVKQNTDDMTALERQLAAGANVNEIAQKAKELMSRGGGIAGMLGQLKTITNTLPADQRTEKFPGIQKEIQDLTEGIRGGTELTSENKQILSLLTERLKSDTDGGAVSEDHAETLKGVLEKLGRIASADEKSIPALVRKGELMHRTLEGMLEMLHYPSHGIPRPPEGSRSARLIELNWHLRRYLFEEMNRPQKGEEESKEALDLTERAERLDRRIYEAGADDTRAMIVEKEELRPLAVIVRNFSARMHTMPTRSIWRSANAALDTNMVFYSGARKWKPSIAAICRSLQLEITAEPTGESYASARWKQLQQAVTAVFDLRETDGSGMSEVTYELGMALTLGRPVVVLVSNFQTIPFDVDIGPVVLTGEEDDEAAVKSAIEQSMVLTYPRPLSDASKTLEYVMSAYPRPHQNTYVDQTLESSASFRTADPLAIERTLAKFLEYLNDEQDDAYASLVVTGLS